MAVTLNANTSTGFIATSDTSGVLQLQTAGTTALTVDASANVGIGTASPASDARLTLASPTTESYVMFSRTNSGVFDAAVGNNAGSLVFKGGADSATVAGLTEFMRIDSSGNVGIGTSSPDGRLHVHNGTAGSVTSQANADDLTVENNANAGISILSPDANVASIYFGSPASAFNAQIESGYNAGAPYLKFNTNAVERMRIDSSGNLLVGQTSQTGTAAGFAIFNTINNGNAARIGLMSLGSANGGGAYPQIGYNTAFTATATINYVASDAASWIRFASGKVETFTAASGTAGNAISATTGPYVAQGGTSWTNSSDERLKDIIEPITGATNKIGQLRAVIGKFKTDPEDKRRSFLIAQDVQAVLPEAVDVSDPESLGVQYTDVIPLLVAAIKEQQAIITSLTDRITALEGTTP